MPLIRLLYIFTVSQKGYAHTFPRDFFFFLHCGDVTSVVNNNKEVNQGTLGGIMLHQLHQCN